jgi:CxxC-x17-CxxC domain-containing protein
MEFVDRQITCVDCAQPFVFTAGEQEFYSRKGFREEPKRCKVCREARKAKRSSGLPEPGGYGSDDHGEDYGNRLTSAGATRDAAPRRGGGAREMFDALCAQCGADTKVPFKPTPGRPVYCRDCYSSRRVGV